MKSETIFLITLINHKQFYVVEDDATKAYEKLRSCLVDNWGGDSKGYDLASIQVIGEKEWDKIYEPISYR